MSEEKENFGGSDLSKPLFGLRLLVVDDSSDNQVLFSRFLVSAGAQVAMARDGAEGVTKCLESQSKGEGYDAVIMDIRMPIMDGYEATRQLRGFGFTGPVIALTAHAVPGEERRCRDAGCSEFLTKPIDRSRLTQTILMAFQSTLDRSMQSEQA